MLRPTRALPAAVLSAVLVAGGVVAAWMTRAADAPPSAPVEPHLKNIRQLTSGGENAEAYFSFDGRQLTLQSSRPPYECDQIFVLDLAPKDPSSPLYSRLVSTGKG
ncbi:MAG TPA: hypothetical protein VF720_08950, partial [Candidatus Eisenbacteria bacterium]